MLHAFLQIDQRAARICHIPVHILRHIEIHTAYGVHYLSEGSQIKFDIIIHADTQQFFHHRHREGTSVALACICVHFRQLALTIHTVLLRDIFSRLIQMADHFIGHYHSGISGNRDHMQFLRGSIKADQHIHIGTETVFISPQHRHIDDILDFFLFRSSNHKV